MIRRLYCLLLVVALTGCATSGRDTGVADAPALTFIHLNDTYRVGAVEDGKRGGFGRVATILRDLGNDGRELRVTHGGDFLYPSLESQLWDGEQMVDALNFLDALAPVYVVPGNHEFDPREPVPLIEAMRRSRFDWVGDNLRLDTGAPDVDRALRRRFTFDAGEHRVGVFSLTLGEGDGGNERHYAPIDTDYVEAARRAIAALDAMNVDLIIGLTHLNLETDRRIAKFREEFPRFLFIAGGHEHEPEFEIGGPSRAAIFKGASNARVIWQIDVTFVDGHRPQIDARQLRLDESIAADEAYQEEVADKWRNRLLEVAPYLTARIGDAAVRLDGREVAVRNEESNLGNFIADQMRGAFGEPADLAFVHGGTLRLDDYVEDDITLEDVERIFGFSSLLRRMTLSGEAFRELLEAGYRGEGPSKGYFPQVSGFRVCVDRGRAEGERIVELQVADGGRWLPIDADEDYDLVAPDFLYRGGDGYDFSAAREVSPPGSELKYLVVDAIIEAQSEGRAVGAPVDPNDPRIVILGDGRDTCFDAPPGR